ncbi:MAG: DUF1565 domain-containing protein, partial [Myxococcota bacterium]
MVGSLVGSLVGTLVGTSVGTPVGTLVAISVGSLMASGCGDDASPPADDGEPNGRASSSGGLYTGTSTSDLDASGGADGTTAGTTDASSTGATTAGGDAESTEGTTGGVCDETGSPADTACLVADAFGIFATIAGDDANAGTRDAPVRSLGAAIALAAGGTGRVFACAETFDEDPLDVPAGVSLYGGLDCTDDWQWTDVPTTVTGGPTALRFSGAGESALEDFHVTAAPAAAGESSIAVLAVDTTLTISRSALIASDAGDGTHGQGQAGAATEGGPGLDGASHVCSAAPASAPAAAVPNASCPSSVGGAG